MFKGVFVDEAYEDEALDGFAAQADKLFNDARRQVPKAPPPSQGTGAQLAVTRSQEGEEAATRERDNVVKAATPTTEEAVERPLSILDRRIQRLEARETVDRASHVETECRRRLELLDKVKHTPSYDRPAFLQWVETRLHDAESNDDTQSSSRLSMVSAGSSMSDFTGASFSEMSMGSFGSMSSFSSGSSSASFSVVPGGNPAGAGAADMTAMATAMAALDAKLTDAQLDRLLAKMKTKHERDKKKRNNYQKVHYRAGGHKKKNLGELEDTMMDEEEERADILHLEPLWLTKIESHWCGSFYHPLILMTIEETKAREVLEKECAVQHLHVQSLVSAELEHQYRTLIQTVLTSPEEAEAAAQGRKQRKWAKSQQGPVELDDFSILRNHHHNQEHSGRSKIQMVAHYEYDAILQDHTLSWDLLNGGDGINAVAPSREGGVMSPSKPSSAGASPLVRRYLKAEGFGHSQSLGTSLVCHDVVEQSENEEKIRQQRAEINAARSRLIDRKVLAKEESLVRSEEEKEETLMRGVLDKHWEHVVHRTYVYVPLPDKKKVEEGGE